jgi:hypothetical protein
MTCEPCVNAVTQISRRLTTSSSMSASPSRVGQAYPRARGAGRPGD